ncbi:ATP-dependent RNA helicase DeaD [Anaerovirgula multivorans]|uniref:ATP-dependent RNA helicase DeaD n=2 Tax=Anaerovirgula multivorans TaxID=312168 RepID=A0A239KPU2_9FIRM|nr:ATP-dependent RNA helicase DeaD [Anaerovirgula multivorans]
MNMKNNFVNLGIDKELEKILNKNGIVEPTAIQKQTIPVLITGRDIIGQAQTGTGKTLAFLLPIMQRIDMDNPSVQALIITPTRELALQITNEAKKLVTAKGIKVLAAYGGQDVEGQVRKLKKSIHMVIGTPGRLLDHIRRRTINFNQLAILVLDEADQMLQMGFLHEVEEIISRTPKSRQTMLFSATMPKEISNIASRYMHKPSHIRIQSKKITLDEIKQVVIETTDRGKQDALFEMIDQYNPFMSIIFCRTKRRASALNEALQSRGYNSDELHGDLSQAKRERVMKAFRETKVQFLVATDVAARGLDVEGITHIFNYDIAQDTESYIHRIGRTGRAGQTGMAITLVTPKDRNTLVTIEKEINMPIEKKKVLGEKTYIEDRSKNFSEKSNKSKDHRHKESRKDDKRRHKNERSGGEKKSSDYNKSKEKDKRARDKKRYSKGR